MDDQAICPGCGNEEMECTCASPENTEQAGETEFSD